MTAPSLDARPTSQATRLEAAGAVLAWLWFARPFLQPGRFVTAFDTTVYSAPNLQVTLDHWREWRLPLWNDLIFAGTPHLGNAQAGALYPPKLIGLALELHRTMGVLVAAHLALLATGSLLLVRRLGARPPGGFVAALVALGNGAILTRATQFEQILVVSWAPWVLLGLYLVVLGDRPTRGTAASIVAITMMGLAGHPQMAYLVAVLAGLWTLDCLVISRRWTRLGHLALVGAGVGCLGALQWLATWAATRDSAVAAGRSLEILTAPGLFTMPSRLGYALFGSMSTESGGLLGGHELVGYVGVGAVVLAIGGVASGRRHTSNATGVPVAGLATAAVLGLVLSLGPRTVVFRGLLRLMPGFDLIRASGRWVTMTALAVSLLAGLGAPSLARRRSRHVMLWALVGGIAALVAAAAAGRLAADRSTVAGWATISGLCVAGLWKAGLGTSGLDAADTTAASRSPRWRGSLPLMEAAPSTSGRWPFVAAALLVVAVAGELLVGSRHAPLFSLGRSRAVTSFDSIAEPRPGLLLSMVEERMSDPEYLVSGLRPNAAALYGVRSIDGYDSGVQVTRRWLDMIAALAPTQATDTLTMRAQIWYPVEAEAARRTAVRWALIDAGAAAHRLTGWRGPVATDGRFELWENPRWTGEGWVVTADGATGPVAVQRDGSDVRLTDVPEGRIMIDTAYANGWHVSLDGSQWRPAIADGLFVSTPVAVPAGATVHFAFRPRWRAPAIALTTIGLLLVAGLLLVDRVRAASAALAALATTAVAASTTAIAAATAVDAGGLDSPLPRAHPPEVDGEDVRISGAGEIT